MTEVCQRRFCYCIVFYGGHSCAACYACLHWCPKNATLLKVPFLKHRPQYHHPDVTLAEIKE